MKTHIFRNAWRAGNFGWVFVARGVAIGYFIGKLWPCCTASWLRRDPHRRFIDVSKLRNLCDQPRQKWMTNSQECSNGFAIREIYARWQGRVEWSRNRRSVPYRDYLVRLHSAFTMPTMHAQHSISASPFILRKHAMKSSARDIEESLPWDRSTPGSGVMDE